MKLKKLLIAAALVAPGFVYAAPTQTTCPIGSQGTTVDLTTGAAAGMQSVNGGFVTWTASQPTGSGFIDSFVRVSANTDCVQGYNTDSRPLQFDENTSATFTHDLLLSAVPIVNIGGVNYREFLLDINQTALAAAHVDQQPDRQRQIGLTREVFDLLWLAVFGQNKIILGEVVDQCSVLVANRGGHVYHLHVDRHVCFFLAAHPRPKNQQA